MAIQFSYTDPESGEVSPQAHLIVHNPLAREETRQVVLRATLYASKADYDAGKQPIREYERVLGQAVYATVRSGLLNLLEPALVANFFPGGARVPD